MTLAPNQPVSMDQPQTRERPCVREVRVQLRDSWSPDRARPATYLAHEDIAASPVLKIHLDTFSGEPTESELGLLDWRPGGGAT